jgi:hypothetical protein
MHVGYLDIFFQPKQTYSANPLPTAIVAYACRVGRLCTLAFCLFWRDAVSFVTNYIAELLALQSQIDLPDGNRSETSLVVARRHPSDGEQQLQIPEDTTDTKI